MHYLSRWYHFTLNKLYTRLRLRGASEAKVATFAALALISLNLHARAGRNAYPIYRLKTQFIRWLHYHGYCTALRLVKQSSPGRPPNILYEFAFAIFGVQYLWHQPYNHVDWVVGTLNESQVAAYVPTGSPAPLSPRQVTILLACLCAALELLGERPVYQETLPHALQKTFRQRKHARPQRHLHKQ